jgi:F0F1-type ATP synthase gamma subunit
MGGNRRDLRVLVREYLFISLFRACAESLASENASRLAAMERADKNINDLLEQLHRPRSTNCAKRHRRGTFRRGSGFEIAAA